MVNLLTVTDLHLVYENVPKYSFPTIKFQNFLGIRPHPMGREKPRPYTLLTRRLRRLDVAALRYSVPLHCLLVPVQLAVPGDVAEPAVTCN